MGERLAPVRVEATAVGKSYDGRSVLRDATFVLEPGTVTVLLGHNGAGKSTLVRRLAGLVRGEGEVRLAGRPLVDHPEPHRVLGVDLGTPQVHPGRTVRSHLRLLAHGMPDAAVRVAQVAELFGVGPLLDRRPTGFSTGMKRGVALAATWIADPSVLVLDEPINGLEVAAVRRVKDLVRRHADRGGTVLVASHVLAEAERIADRVLVLEGGGVVAHQDLAGYVARAGAQDIDVVTDDQGRLEAALAAAGIASRSTATGVVVSGVSQRAVAECARDAGVLVLELRPRRPTLEDVFLSGGVPAPGSVERTRT
ncbi:ABC transporter ATP-binding protein [Cellulomonas triticagri]|uniref:ABC transporter ATP-binding protein n=1 Tax=Cellulomonas triticagri TaxID=2483352 RepID=UPI0013159821|nr:ABC transporter ATP-binding protein [Cellulomonas triticagri]